MLCRAIGGIVADHFHVGHFLGSAKGLGFLLWTKKKFFLKIQLPFDQVPEMYKFDMEPLRFRYQPETFEEDKTKPRSNPHEYFVMYGDQPLTSAQIQLARYGREDENLFKFIIRGGLIVSNY